MACAEHVCRCGHVFFDNGTNDGCPECGSSDYSTHFDEYEPEPEDEPTAREVMDFRQKAAGVAP